MKAFRVTGSFQMGHNWQPFSKEFAALDENGAREKALSIFGSKHRVRRDQIKITEVSECKEPEDPLVISELEKGK